MSDDSADFTVNNEEEERRARSGRSGGMAKRLKTLLCCLKREPHAEETVIGYNPDEFDYVVEKLVVKRVPLALFAIPADLADNASRSTSSSSENVARETPARAGKRTATNEALHFGDERRDSAGSLDCQARSSVWRGGISSKFDALHSDLKESECPLKHPLNVSRSRRLFAEDISEATSSTGTDVSSRTSSMTVQDDVPTRDDSTHRESSFPASFGKERDKFVPGWNRKYIVSPFRVRKGSFDLAKPKDTLGDLRLDGKSLSYIKESPEDKSSEPTKDVKDRNLGLNAVRWRVTIRRQRASATLEHAVSEV